MGGRRKGGRLQKARSILQRKKAEDQEGNQEKHGRSAGNAMFERWKVWTPCYPHPTCCISFSQIARQKAN